MSNDKFQLIYARAEVRMTIDKLNDTSITQLKALLDSVVKQVQDNDRSNSASHKRLWEHNEEQDETLQRHEQRLHDLDGK